MRSQARPTLCNPMVYSPPVSSVHGIFKNTGVDCHFLFQRIVPTQRTSPHCLHPLHWQADSLALAPPGKPGNFTQTFGDPNSPSSVREASANACYPEAPCPPPLTSLSVHCLVSCSIKKTGVRQELCAFICIRTHLLSLLKHQGQSSPGFWISMTPPGWETLAWVFCSLPSSFSTGSFPLSIEHVGIRASFWNKRVAVLVLVFSFSSQASQRSRLLLSLLTHLTFSLNPLLSDLTPTVFPKHITLVLVTKCYGHLGTLSHSATNYWPCFWHSSSFSFKISHCLFSHLTILLQGDVCSDKAEMIVSLCLCSSG